MALIDNGDVIKGIGYVAIYSAYLEESIDDCIELLISKGILGVEVRKLQASRKIKELKNCLNGMSRKPSRFAEIQTSLDIAKDLLEHRNQLLHGRIYSTPTGDRLESSRVGVPDREICSNEAYELANKLFDMRNPFNYAANFDLPKVL